MADILSWAATATTILAALMTASNLGSRVTGYGFAVFTIGALCWLIVGAVTYQPALLWTWNGTIERMPYLLTGTSLFLVKFVIDWLIANLGFGRSWSPLNYRVSSRARSAEAIAPLTSWRYEWADCPGQQHYFEGLEQIRPRSGWGEPDGSQFRRVSVRGFSDFLRLRSDLGSVRWRRGAAFGRRGTPPGQFFASGGLSDS